MRTELHFEIPESRSIRFQASDDIRAKAEAKEARRLAVLAACEAWAAEHGGIRRCVDPLDVPLKSARRAKLTSSYRNFSKADAKHGFRETTLTLESQLAKAP